MTRLTIREQYLRTLHHIGQIVYWKNTLDEWFTGAYIITSKPEKNGYIGIYNNKVGHCIVPSFYVTDTNKDNILENPRLARLRSYIDIHYKTIHDIQSNVNHYIRRLEKRHRVPIEITNDLYTRIQSSINTFYQEGSLFGTGHFKGHKHFNNELKHHLSHIDKWYESHRDIVTEDIYKQTQIVFHYLFSTAFKLGLELDHTT